MYKIQYCGQMTAAEIETILNAREAEGFLLVAIHEGKFIFRDQPTQMPMADFKARLAENVEYTKSRLFLAEEKPRGKK